MAKKQTTTAPLTQLAPSGPAGRRDLDEAIETCLAAPMEGKPWQEDCLWGLPVLNEGLPGNAKSARVKQMGKVLKVKAKSIFLAQHPPEDLAGALVPDGKGGARQICPLLQVRELMADGEGIIHLDELNGAPPATHGAAQSFIHERMAGDQLMPGRIRIIASQNPEGIATGGYRLPTPLANRFVHLTDPGPSAREWNLWCMEDCIDEEEDPTDKLLRRTQPTLALLEKQVSKAWKAEWRKTTSLFSAFLESAPSVMHRMPPENDPEASKAWPSPRTWDYAKRAWTTATILQRGDQVRDMLIHGCVGTGAADMFLEYARNTDIPKPEDVLSGKWEIDVHRIDIVFAAYTGAVTFIRQQPSRDNKLALAAKMWSALGRLFDASLADVVLPCVEHMLSERLGIYAEKAEVVKAAKEVLMRLSQSGMQSFIDERPV